MHVFGLDMPRVHATLNELPVLLVVAVLFELGGWLTGRASLKVAALWTLWAGVIGGWAAVLAGELAKKVIEGSDPIRDLTAAHERIGLATMLLFTAILGWKLWRREQRGPWEEAILRIVSVAGVVGVIWAQVVGGHMVFDHAVGIDSKTMKAELLDRQQHQHTRDGRSQTPDTLPRTR